MAKKDQGFTLVELIVTIAVGAMVTLAATTVILMGMRLNRNSMGIATRQNTTRIFLSAMEKMASDGSISGFRMDCENWNAYGSGGETDVIYTYDAANQVISAKGTPLMEDVLSSYINYEDGLLTVFVETEEGMFDSTIYCRMPISVSGISGVEIDDEEEDIKEPDGTELENALKPNVQVPDVTEAEARKEFLVRLISQYRITTGANIDEPIKNHGVILNNGASTGSYFSEWYITSNWTSDSGKKAWASGTWNSRTPWCACFVTWGVDQVMNKYTDYGDENPRPYYAGVDSFMAYFKKGAYGNEWHDSAFYFVAPEGNAGETAYVPKPGDVIFYDWVINDVKDPQHVGVVIGVATEKVGDKMVDYVYTIEGNVSNASSTHGVVGVRKYKLTDARILGYGVLDWVGNAQTDTN